MTGFKSLRPMPAPGDPGIGAVSGPDEMVLARPDFEKGTSA